MSQIRRFFPTWGELREAAGLEARPARRRVKMTEDELLEEYHRLVMLLRRLPSQREIDKLSTTSTNTLARRFGTTADILAAYKKWLGRRRREQKEQIEAIKQGNFSALADDSEKRDVDWLRTRWEEMRVGFEIQSSDFEGRPATACDLLVVLDHNWPSCPVPVVEFATLQPHNR